MVVTPCLKRLIRDEEALIREYMFAIFSVSPKSSSQLLEEVEVEEELVRSQERRCGCRFRSFDRVDGCLSVITPFHVILMSTPPQFVNICNPPPSQN